jgi:hypothetical protein
MGSGFGRGGTSLHSSRDELFLYARRCTGPPATKPPTGPRPGTPEEYDHRGTRYKIGVPPPFLTVVLYTRAGCHLCDKALLVLEEVQRTRPFELRVVDIDAELRPGDARFSTYTLEVPVVEVNGRKAFKYRVDPEALERTLERAAS